MRRQALPLVPLLALMPLTAPACSSAPAGDAESTGRAEERALGELDVRWPSSTLAVCWRTPSSDTQAMLGVQKTVSAAYAPAGVVFTGWGACPPGPFDGVAITIAEQNPSSDIGGTSPPRWSSTSR